MTEVEQQIKKILDDYPEDNRRILELQLETLVIKAKREQMKRKFSSNIGRWNYKTKEYDPYELPEGAILYTRDMDREISCASCGKKIVFGDGYTSRRIHNKYGTGFSVCMDCHEKEREKENEIYNRYKKQRVERTK